VKAHAAVISHPQVNRCLRLVHIGVHSHDASGCRGERDENREKKPRVKILDGRSFSHGNPPSAIYAWCFAAARQYLCRQYLFRAIFSLKMDGFPKPAVACFELRRHVLQSIALKRKYLTNGTHLRESVLSYS
jgi:hypothetical protein